MSKVTHLVIAACKQAFSLLTQSPELFPTPSVHHSCWEEESPRQFSFRLLLSNRWTPQHRTLLTHCPGNGLLFPRRTNKYCIGQKNPFGFSCKVVQKTWTNILADPNLQYFLIITALHTCLHACSSSHVWLWPNGLQPTRLLYPWNFPGKKYQSEFPFPTPGDLPGSEVRPSASAASPAWQAVSLPLLHLASIATSILFWIFIHILLIVFQWPLSGPQSNPGTHKEITCYATKTFPNLGQFLKLLLPWGFTHEKYRPGILQNIFQIEFVWCFLIIHFKSCILGQEPQYWCRKVLFLLTPCTQTEELSADTPNICW